MLKVLFAFVVLVSTTMPFRFNVFNLNGFLIDFLEVRYKNLGFLLFPNQDIFLFASDSIILYLHILICFLLALGIGFISTKNFSLNHLSLGLFTFCRYYLALFLLIYGCNKLFKVQFYDAFPNTAFTPVGQHTKDFLYWTSMGSSSLYNRITGFIEIFIGFLLFFRNSKVLAAFLAWLVIAHIVLINFAFDISAKVQSLFLLLLCTILVAPYISVFAKLFKGENIQLPNFSKSKFKGLKIIVILCITIEAFGPYVKSRNWNGDLRTMPPFFGAYEIKNSDHYKRFFIHEDPYFIIQTKNDEFYSFNMIPNYIENKILLIQEKDSIVINFQVTSGRYLINGNLFGKEIDWQAIPINYTNLPLYNDNFEWFIENYQ